MRFLNAGAKLQNVDIEISAEVVFLGHGSAALLDEKFYRSRH